MKIIDKTKQAVIRKLPLLLVIFCVIQPLLDALGFWQDRLGLPNLLTTLIRMALLGAMALLGFWLSQRRWVYVAVFGVLALYLGGHVWACSTQNSNVLWAIGYQDPKTDLLNQIRILLLPVTTLCLITFLRRNGDCFRALKKGLLLTLAVIAGIMLLATVTGTDPHTYNGYDDMVPMGVLGWFLWTNSQSAVLSMLVPLAIFWAADRWKTRLLPTLLVTAAAEATLFFLGPRLAYAALAAAGFGLGLMLILKRQSWKPIVAVLLVTCVFLGLYPLSTTYARTREVAAQNEEEQRRISLRLGDGALKSGDGADAVMDLEQPYLRNLVLTYYSLGVHGPMRRFGVERTMAKYNYTREYAQIGNQRNKKLAFCSMLMDDASFQSHLFGLDLCDMKEQEGIWSQREQRWVDENYDVENDFHGIYYLCGGVGLGLMIGFLGLFLVLLLRRLTKNFKQTFTVETAAFAISFACALAHAYFTASILRRNNASVFLAVILACLWYLSSDLKLKRETACRGESHRDLLRGACSPADDQEASK